MKEFYIELVRNDDIPGVFPKKYPFLLKDYQEFIDNSKNYIYYHEASWYKGIANKPPDYVEIKRYDLAYFNHPENVLERIKYPIQISLSNTGSILFYSWEGYEFIYLYEELYELSKKLNANMYYDAWEHKGKMVKVDESFMNVLRLRLGENAKSNEQILKYTIPNKEGRYMAISEENHQNITKYILSSLPKEIRKKIVTNEMSWDSAFDNLSDDCIFITPCIDNWVYVTGLELHKILPYFGQSNDAQSDFLKGLETLSKKFKKVRWFESSEKYNLDIFFKADNGKIKYGRIETEEGITEIGIKPKELSKIENLNSEDAAKIWTRDPGDFLYMPELMEIKVTEFRFL